MSAASRAKRNQPELNVTVLEKTQDVSYSACGMPYNIADPDRPMDDLVVRQAQAFRDKQGINLLTGHTATAIDRKAGLVSGITDQGKSFSVEYDRLLIATGGSPIMPDVPGVNLPGVLPLKNLGDGRNIKGWMAEHKVAKALILGMGYIGLEMCEALRERGVEVAMAKPRNVFLPWMARDLAAVVFEELERNGVEMLLGQEVREIMECDDGLEVVLSDGRVTTGMVIPAMGIRPNSQLAQDAGLELGPGDAISVDRQLKTSDTAIYAAGDCADAVDMVTGEKAWMPLALRANRAGWAVADNVCGKQVELSGIVGTAVFKVFGLQVARTGLNEHDATRHGFDPVTVTIKSRSRAHAHPGSATIWVHMVGDKKTGRLLGVQMVGPEGVAHRINAGAVALHNRMTVEAFSQTDLAYAPPFGPVWDPMLVAANQLKKLLPVTS